MLLRAGLRGPRAAGMVQGRSEGRSGPTGSPDRASILDLKKFMCQVYPYQDLTSQVTTCDLTIRSTTAKPLPWRPVDFGAGIRGKMHIETVGEEEDTCLVRHRPLVTRVPRVPWSFGMNIAEKDWFGLVLLAQAVTRT